MRGLNRNKELDVFCSCAKACVAMDDDGCAVGLEDVTLRSGAFV